MIVADTNVLSEPLRPTPDPHVLRWLSEHRREIAITTITVGELRYGAERLPAGRRRSKLQGDIEHLISGAADRLLSYDEAAAGHYARLRAVREAQGHPVSVEDTMIAGICLAIGAELATRNLRHFSGTGLTIHNPWEDASIKRNNRAEP